MPDDPDSGQKLDRTVFTVSDGFDDGEAQRYWHSRPRPNGSPRSKSCEGSTLKITLTSDFSA